MVSTTKSRRQGQSTSEHERLLQETVERLVVLRYVMRLAIQQVHAGFAKSDAASRSSAIDAAWGGTRGVGQAQFYVLHALAELGELTVGEIADHCHVAAPTISKMLNHLEMHRLIERHVDPSNRRVVRVVLTEDGRVTHAYLERVFMEALMRVLDPLTDVELRDVIAAFGHLERLVTRTKAQRA